MLFELFKGQVMEVALLAEHIFVLLDDLSFFFLVLFLETGSELFDLVFEISLGVAEVLVILVLQGLQLRLKVFEVTAMGLDEVIDLDLLFLDEAIEILTENLELSLVLLLDGLFFVVVVPDSGGDLVLEVAGGITKKKKRYEIFFCKFSLNGLNT